MIDRLRLRLSRPLGDVERHPAFTACAVILVALAGVLTAISEQPSQENAGLTQTADPGAGLIGATEAPAPDQAPHGVGRVAHRFLIGYLNHLYERADARSIQGASPALLARLSSRQVRVSVGMRSRRPRITDLEAHPFNGDWLVSAEIADGGTRFPVELIVTRHARAWVVARVVED